MISNFSTIQIDTAHHPTVWGLDPTHLYDRFWAARGIQVVRQGEPSEIVEDAELFLLTDPRSMVMFKLGSQLMERLSWVQPVLYTIRLHESREQSYREIVLSDEDGTFRGFKRIYGGSMLARVALTPDHNIARAWQKAPDPRTGWKNLRKIIPRTDRMSESKVGNVYDRTVDHEVMECVRRIVELWRRPNSTVRRTDSKTPGVWTDRESSFDHDTHFTGPVWVGAGKHDIPETAVIGPAVLWDKPDNRPDAEQLAWDEIEPTNLATLEVKPKAVSETRRVTKRVFDIVLALMALALTLPIYPFVMLAIWLEDGRPFFFAHRRETLGGKLFPCLKFRSMRTDAEKIKEQLRKEQVNQADGPQFFMDNDPRLTRVGVFIRKVHIDELPQFINVLRGHMSLVGPRPSPRSENQYCPAWREARLSVRPGITGLWQVQRTREMGLDFQEWIRYDIEYVETSSWWLDIKIMCKTIWLIVRGAINS